ncbi:MAG: radical SAM protein, partial [Actinomycetota bacterium]|nr:radical SAM protein [Actinomycetota bacterium]
AQDATSYGIDLPNNYNLAELISRISRIDHVRWIRLLYLQPEVVTEELLSEIASNRKVCHYFDIPFHHASEKILRLMGRSGSGDEYIELIHRIRKAVPDAAIRTTMMIGFPGETDADFELVVDFVRDARIDWLGLFVFSPEEGTKAKDLPQQVPVEVAQSRYDTIVSIQDEIADELGFEFIGREMEVVVDEVSDTDEYQFISRSFREAPDVDGVIYLRNKGTTEITKGCFTKATIIKKEGLDLAGEIR